MIVSARIARDFVIPGSYQIAEKGPDIREPQLPDDHFRCAPFPLIFVAWNFCDAKAPLEGLHHHLLLNRGQVRGQTQISADVPADRAKTVLAVCQTHVPPVIDPEHDDLRTNIED